MTQGWSWTWPKVISPRTRQFIRYRARAILRWPQIKQYTAFEGGGWLQNRRGYHIILTEYEAVHPTVVSEKYSSSWMLTILIKFKIVFILSIIFAGKFTHIIYIKGQNNIFPKLINLKHSATFSLKYFEKSTPRIQGHIAKVKVTVYSWQKNCFHTISFHGVTWIGMILDTCNCCPWPRSCCFSGQLFVPLGHVQYTVL